MPRLSRCQHLLRQCTLPSRLRTHEAAYLRLELKAEHTYKCGSKGSVTCLRLLQIHVFDKLDYCGTLKNLEDIVNLPNFQVSHSHQSIWSLSYCLSLALMSPRQS